MDKGALAALLDEDIQAEMKAAGVIPSRYSTLWENEVIIYRTMT